MKIFGSLYKRAKVDLGVCVYCGEARQCLDHVPPISRVEGLNLKSFWKSGEKLLLYPSCFECNNLLGAKYILPLLERLEALETIYEAKMSTIEKWSEAEIKELDYTLRTYILSQGRDLDRYVNKHATICNNIDDIYMDL